jgi:hypothetical protein
LVRSRRSAPTLGGFAIYNLSYWKIKGLALNMASFPETKILEGFAARLAAMTFSPVMPVSYPNRSFSPPANGKYLRARHLPNTTTQITLGASGFNRHQGLFQIDVMWPLDAGEVAPKEIAGAIIANFKLGTEFTREDLLIRIPAPPSVAPALIDGVSYMIPITVRYQADAANS